MAKKSEYIASRDNTSVGRSGINENVDNVKPVYLAGNDIMSLIMSFMPVIGDVQDVVDLKESIEDKDAIGIALGSASLFPFVGSAATYVNKARKLEKMKESAVSYYKNIVIPMYREVSNNKISKLNDGAKKAFQIMDKKKIDPERISDHLDYFEGVMPDELDAAKYAYEYMKHVDDFSDGADDRFKELKTSFISRSDLEKMGHGTAMGLYDPKTNAIYIGDDLNDEYMYYSLVHEIGHGIDKNDRLNKIESGIFIDDEGLDLIKRAYSVPSDILPRTDHEKRLYDASMSVHEKIQTNREFRAKLYNILKEITGVEHPTLGELRALIDEGGLYPKETRKILGNLNGYGEVYSKNITSGREYEQNDLIKEALKNVPSALLPYVLLNAYKEDSEKPDFKKGGWYPSDTLIDFLISKEGFEPRVRVPSKPNKKTGKKDKETTGYGVTDEDIVKRNKGKTITRSQAKRDFMEAVGRRIGQFTKATPNFDKLNNNERDALFSYFYNIGYGGYTDQSPELQKALSNLDKEKIALNIDFDYNNEDRKGAMKRRNAERRLFRLPMGENFEFHIKSDDYPENQENTITDVDNDNDVNYIIKAALGIKNDLEMQHPISTTRDEAFREARKKGLKVFTWDGKKYNTKMKKNGGPVAEGKEDGGAKYRYIASVDDTPAGWDVNEKPEMEEGGFVPDWMLQRNKLINKRGAPRCKDGGEANRWWKDPEEKDRVVKRQEEAANRQEKRRKLIEQANSDFENGEINEDEYRRIVGFSNSRIGDLIISKDGNGEEIGAIINSLLNSIDVDKVKKGIVDAKEGKEEKNKEDAYPYKLMAESLLALADVASSTPGMLRLYDKMGLRLMPLLKTIAESSKIQTIAGLSNMGVDGSQIALDPEGDNAFNYAGILGGAAEAIGGTNIIRNTSLMGRYGNKVDDVLDVVNPIISTLGIADDVTKKEDGGETDEEIFRKLYKEDVERVKNGEKAMFFGELNDTPIEEVHPELMLASRLSAVSGIIDGLDDIKKGEYAEAFASGLLGFVPFAAKKAASYIRKEGLIRGVLKDFNETIDRWGDDFIKGEKYLPSRVRSYLSNKHNKEIMEAESAIGDDRLLHVRPERVNPNGTLGVRNLKYYTVDEFRRKSANGKTADLAKVWWTEDTPMHYSGDRSTIVSIRKDLDKMDMESQKFLGGRDHIHVSNSLDLRDPELDSKVYRAYYDGNFVPESHRIGPTVYEDGGVVKKQREVYKYLTEKRGMSKIQALAVIGNLMAESMLKDDIYGDNGTSYGIQQWHNERMDMLFKQARKKGHSEPTFQDQIEFLADEYEGKTGYSNFLYTRKGKDGPGYYNYSKQDFQNAETLQDAVIAWNQGAGRPHKSVTRNATRYELAKKAAENLGLKIEEDIKPRYGQMGFDTDFTVKEDQEEPQVEASYVTGYDEDMAGQQVPIGAEASGIAKEDMFKLWTETYGKDIVANLMSLKTDDGDSRAIDEEYEERYKQYVKESEEDKKRALIEAILPGLQLKIKGMTD